MNRLTKKNIQGTRWRASRLAPILLACCGSFGLMQPSTAQAWQTLRPPTTAPRTFVPKHQRYAQPGGPVAGHPRMAAASHAKPRATSSSIQQTFYQASGTEDHPATGAQGSPRNGTGPAADPSAVSPAEQPPLVWEEAAPYVETDGPYIEEAYPYVEAGSLLPGVPLGMGSSFWGRSEYLLWWTRGMNAPPLATTSVAGTNQDQAGVLGLDSTDVLFGNSRVNEDSRSGGRFTLGTWLDACQTSGFEGSYLFLGSDDTSFAASDASQDILARPFFNTDLNAEDSRLIVFPDLVDGSLAIQTETEFDSAEALYRRAALRTDWTDIDYYLGYRYAGLDDSLSFVESTTSLAGATAGAVIDLQDHFSTRNTFHGGQLGVRMLRRASPTWSLELLGKFAVGGTRSRSTINGQTTTTTADGATSTATGGLLALPTNIGTAEDSQFTTITEFGVTARHQLRNGWTASFGYSLLYWSDVVRAGNVVDRTVNPTQIPPGNLVGEQRPAVSLETTDFWAQGLNFGLERHF